MSLLRPLDPAFPIERQIALDAAPVVLVNVCTLDKADEQTFLQAWQDGNDVVWGIRSTRSVPKGLGNAMSRLFSKWFHRWSTIPTYPAEGPSIVLGAKRRIHLEPRVEAPHRLVDEGQVMGGRLARDPDPRLLCGFHRLDDLARDRQRVLYS